MLPVPPPDEPLGCATNAGLAHPVAPHPRRFPSLFSKSRMRSGFLPTDHLERLPGRQPPADYRVSRISHPYNPKTSGEFEPAIRPKLFGIDVEFRLLGDPAIASKLQIESRAIVPKT